MFDDKAEELHSGVQTRSGSVAGEFKEAAERSLARELGVRRNQLYKWKEQLSRRGEQAFPGHGRTIASHDEVSRLRQELERVKEERDILKKAAAYFAKELK